MGVAAVKHTQLNSHQAITLSQLPSVSSVEKMAISFLKLFTGSYKVRMYGAKFRVLVKLQVVFTSPP
jgi:hypothetical protein